MWRSNPAYEWHLPKPVIRLLAALLITILLLSGASNSWNDADVWPVNANITLWNHTAIAEKEGRLIMDDKNTNFENAPLNQEALKPDATQDKTVTNGAPSNDAADPDNLKQDRKKKVLKEIREWIVSLAVALIVVLIIQNFLFTLIRVDGHSMDPTLNNGERMFVTVADVRFGDVERNSVVICHYPNRGRTNFVKRCVAVPGDSVYRENGVNHVVYTTTDEVGNTVIIDEPLDERYAVYNINGSPDDFDAYQLGENEYFVVGDNRYNSHDSRDWNDSDPSNDVGPISKSMIVGRVRYVFWPLSNIRSID